jgi:hypothetical protein
MKVYCLCKNSPNKKVSPEVLLNVDRLSKINHYLVYTPMKPINEAYKVHVDNPEPYVYNGIRHPDTVQVLECPVCHRKVIFDGDIRG